MLFVAVLNVAEGAINNMKKWHIYNKKYKDFLYWDEYLLEFDTYASAERFLQSIGDYKIPEEDRNEIVIKQGIVVCDSPVLNASKHIVGENEVTAEEELLYIGD